MMSVTLRYGDIKGCQVLLINEHNDDGKRCNAAMFIMLLVAVPMPLEIISRLLTGILVLSST